MQKKSKTHLRLLLPLMLILPLLCIMMGCIYIPTWNQPVLIATKKDFRDWTDQNSTRKPGSSTSMTRAKVEAMFGKPRYRSKNGKCVAYVMQTVKGITIFPQCFGAGFNNGEVYVVEIDYDDAGQIVKISPMKDYISPPMYEFFSKQYGSDEEDLNGHNLLKQWNQKHPADQQIEDVTMKGN